MTEIFKFYISATYNLRSGPVLERRHDRTNDYGAKSISTLDTKF